MKITQTFSGPDGLTGERCSGLVSEGSISRQIIISNTFYSERLKAFLLFRNKTKMSLLSLIFNIV